MNVAVSALPLAPWQVAGDQRQVGEISAAWQLAPHSLMVLGWQQAAPTREGIVALQAAGALDGRFIRFAWTTPLPTGTAYGFVAAIDLPRGASIQAGDALHLKGRRGGDQGVLAHMPPFFLEAASFGAELARAATGAAASTVARFLTDLFAPATTADNPHVRRMLLAFLQAASEADGCIELLGTAPGSCAFLQGWGRPVQGACEVIVAGTELRRHTAQEACFERQDIPGPATGHALVLPADAPPPSRETVLFLLTRTGIRRRCAVAECQALSEREIVAHLRDLLPSLRCGEEAGRMLAAALRPRFEGRETLSEAARPVRLSIDLAADLPTGCYLSGWLYDPAGIVGSVHFRSTAGQLRRLDDRWTRIPRPDVSEGFRLDPQLPAGEPGCDEHGFAVSLPCSATVSGEVFYLDIQTIDGWSGFVPLLPSRMTSEAAAAGLLSSVDMFKPSGMAVIECQVAPFLMGMPQPGPSVQGRAPILPARPVLIVVPLATVHPPRALLSGLMADPLGPDEAVLFVCGDDWTDTAIASLEALSRFYGISPSVARISASPGPGAALIAAAELSQAEQFMLLDSGIIGRTAGWRLALSSACRDGACVSPTVLYEDNSLRYAGIEGIDPLPDSPYIRVQAPLAGLPATFARPGAPVPTAGVSAACCVLPRAVAEALKARQPLSVTAAWDTELDLLARLFSAGARCLWAPGVQVYVPEADIPPDDPSRRVRRLVARWSLRAHLNGLRSSLCAS